VNTPLSKHAVAELLLPHSDRAGPAAEGNVRNYIVDGNMTGGFAFLTYPAEYRKTGVMSFPINQDGQLFQKDLGAQTAELAESLTSFDPDPRWSPVQ
jgi:Protein of unknown function (DUF2950)